MTDAPDAEDALRRRARRLVEEASGEDGPAVVALLADAGEPGASWRAAAALADAWTARRRTLLVNLAGEGSGLDRYLEVEGRDGLEAVRSGERTLSEAAVHPPDRGFLYLPSGSSGAADRPRPTEDRPFLRALAGLADRVREARGLLLLYLESGALPEALAEELVEGAVPLVGARPHLPGSVPVLGRLAEDVEDAGAAPEAPTGPTGPAAGTDGPDGQERGEEEGAERSSEPEPPLPPPWAEDEDGAGDDEGSGRDDGPWRRHRRSATPPWGKIAAGAAAILLLAGGWWWLAGRTTPGEAEAGGSSGPAVADTGTGATPVAGASAGTAAGPEVDSVPAGAVTDSAGGPRPAGPAPGEVVEASAELPHSVLVASYASWPAARSRAERFRTEAATWIVAPTPVRGSLYWRLYAGALPDEDAARRLMRRLVDSGVKDRARDWDVRPASLAYRLAVATDRATAEERSAEMRERGIPAYLLPAAAGGDTVWQVLAGAYESEGAARRLGEMLEEEGVEAELVRRRGEGGDT